MSVSPISPRPSAPETAGTPEEAAAPATPHRRKHVQFFGFEFVAKLRSLVPESSAASALWKKSPYDELASKESILITHKQALADQRETILEFLRDSPFERYEAHPEALFHERDALATQHTKISGAIERLWEALRQEKPGAPQEAIHRTIETLEQLNRGIGTMLHYCQIWTKPTHPPLPLMEALQVYGRVLSKQKSFLADSLSDCETRLRQTEGQLAQIENARSVREAALSPPHVERHPEKTNIKLPALDAPVRTTRIGFGDPVEASGLPSPHQRMSPAEIASEAPRLRGKR